MSGCDVVPALLFRNGRVGRSVECWPRRCGSGLGIVNCDALLRRRTRIVEVMLLSARKELLDELDAVGLVDG